MVQIREISRTAVFAWSPGTGRPLLVTGTRAGAIDADFSDETKLELWDLSLENQHQPGFDLQPICSISTDSRFYDVAWSPPDSDHPRGVIAGALENGCLDLWDAEKLASCSTDAFMERATKHSGAIKALQFNPLKPQILATGGANGELFIYNIEDVQNPFKLSSAAVSRADDIECLSWNKKVSHILATGSAGGLVTVWDVKTKKASLSLNNNRKAVSAIAWDPSNSTKLLTATSDDNTPVVYLWNLRNSNAPEKILSGHEQGVLSLSWCQQDPTILLSCGKDNRTLVWNPQSGTMYGELQQGTNWAFLTSFCPDNPNLTATASFDGKITIQTLQNANNASDSQDASQNALDGEDFFASAQITPSVTSFSLSTPPSWFLKPVGAAFGFGGKLVFFTLKDTPAGQPQSSTVYISQFSPDSGVASTTEQFEEALKSGDVEAICASHVELAKSDEERADWEVLATLVDSDPRRKVIERLGFDIRSPAADGGYISEALQDTNMKSTANNIKGGTPSSASARPATTEDKEKGNSISSLFEDGEECEVDGDGFLSGLASVPVAEKHIPFRLLGQGNTSLEDTITRAVILGNFSLAVDICLRENRVADAFVIANCGGKDLVQKVQKAYLAEADGSPSYLRLLNSITTENLWDIVHNADLADWKETLATLCTFAKPAEFSEFCVGLGDRVLATGSRKDASFCYLVGSKLQKVVEIWIGELNGAERTGVHEQGEDSFFSVHAKSLQRFIEKVTIFRYVTKFEDDDVQATSGWKLGRLYDRYIEFADIVAAAGLMGIAQKYLDLVPAAYPAAEIARNRVKLALRNDIPQRTRNAAFPETRHVTGRTFQKSVGVPVPQPLVQPSQGAVSAGSQQASSSQTVSSNPYAPPSTTQTSPYAPANTSAFSQAYSTPQQSSAYGPPTAIYGSIPAPGYGSPARTATPSVPPPPKAKDVGSWNDVPMVTRPPVRKTTPNVAPITAPFGTQQNILGLPPASSPYGNGPRGTSTPPPPPRGPAPARVSSPLEGPPVSTAVPPRPPSSIAGTYAPPPPPPPGIIKSPTTSRPPFRAESPYNPPPAGPPQSSRYAPAPAPQLTGSGPTTVGPPPGTPTVPPPGSFRASSTSSYVPLPPPSQQQQHHAGHQAGGQPPPPVGPPPGSSRPPNSVPNSSLSSDVHPEPTSFASHPGKPKYPPGDRSHIPVHAQRLVHILRTDLQRVASKAPERFAPQVKDTDKRLNILFDHLNNGELVKAETIQQLHSIAEALENKSYDIAQKIQVDIHREKSEECGNWMVGLKRLIAMSKATP